MSETPYTDEWNAQPLDNSVPISGEAKTLGIFIALELFKRDRRVAFDAFAVVMELLFNEEKFKTSRETALKIAAESE